MGRKSDPERVSCYVGLDGVLKSQIEQYREAVGHQTLSEAIKELCRMALSKEIDTSLIVGVRQKTAWETQQWAMGYFRTAATQMLRDMREMEK